MKPRLNSLAKCQVSRLEETWHHCYGEAWWWQHHAVGMFFRDWETSQDRGKHERSKVQRSLLKTCSKALRTSDLGEGSTSNRTTTLSTQPRQCRSVFGGEVFECPCMAQPEPRLEPDRTSLERAENSCAAMLPIQPGRAWEEWEKLRKYRCAKLVVSYPRILDAVIAAQRCFNKVLSKWCVNVNITFT